MSDWVVSILTGIGMAVATAVASVLWSDQRQRGKLDAQSREHDKNVARLDALEQVERQNLAEHSSLETTVRLMSVDIARLDNQKASKEVVDGFRREISELKFDMDRRFDKLERLITRLAGRNGDTED
jgi:hypothetical protein